MVDLVAYFLGQQQPTCTSRQLGIYNKLQQNFSMDNSDIQIICALQLDYLLRPSTHLLDIIQNQIAYCSETIVWRFTIQPSHVT